MQPVILSYFTIAPDPVFYLLLSHQIFIVSFASGLQSHRSSSYIDPAPLLPCSFLNFDSVEVLSSPLHFIFN